MTYRDHTECIYLAITQLGKQEVILGYTWLAKHNPEIDFTTGGVKMTCCKQTQGCMGCKAEKRAEKIVHRREKAQVSECKKGSLPTFAKDYDEEEDLPPLPPVTPSDPGIEVGDHIFAVMNDAPELTIHTTATISQRLAEAHHKNSALPDVIPDYL